MGFKEILQNDRPGARASLLEDGNLLVYGLSSIFIALNLVLIANGFFWLSILPLLVVIVLLLVFSLDKLLYLTVFLTPSSVNLGQAGFGTMVSLPVEPIMFAIMLVFLFKNLYRNTTDRHVYRHPMSILIIINLIWIFMTSITSELPLVSFKFLLSRLWFIVPFYFLSVQIFKNIRRIKSFLWCYMIPLSGVIIYSIYNLWAAGFDEQISQDVMYPFYPSHTSYGAIIAMFIPFLLFTAVNVNGSYGLRVAGLCLFILFAVAILFSYSRAVWVSLPIAFAAYLAIRLRVRFGAIMISVAVVASLLLTFQSDILMQLERNKQDSSEEFTENFQSISNISTDDSNTERLNRWSSAISMFVERPIFGWGPGTYQFLYAPFQKSYNLTLISTNAGNRGNAHSEYIGPLAESGVLGSLSFIAIVLCSLFIGLRVIYRGEQRARWLATTILLGLITYFVHAFLNNYLDTDKLSVPFWGFMAMLTALDLHETRREDAGLKELAAK